VRPTLPPTSIAVTKPDPKPIAEARILAGAKPFPAIKRAAESGATAELEGAVERKEPTPEGTTAEVKPAAEIKPVTGITAAGSKLLGATITPATAKPSTLEPPLPLIAAQASPGVTTEAPVLSTAISPKPDHARDAIAPSTARQTTETFERMAAPSKVETGPDEPRVERPASVDRSAEFVAAKEAPSPVKPKPSTGQDKPGPAVLSAEKLRSPKPAAVRISEERTVRGLAGINEPETERVKKEESVVEAPPLPAPSIPAMFIVMIAPELAPAAKVGGLADVVYGLSRELELRGNAVEVFLPKYDCMRYDQISGLTRAYENLWVPWYNGSINTSVWFGFVHGCKCFFIEPHSRDNFFNRGTVYGHNDDLLRFAFFCRAVLEFMFKTGKQPEIIHCHDWQTALVPVLLYEVYQHLGMRHPRVCFTVHNFRHQGAGGDYILRATGLHRPEHFMHYDRLRDNHNPHALNLMKGGIVYSNFVTTVSPRHAWEAKDGGQAHGLERTLQIHHYKYGGVLNGLDYNQFNPATDPHIPAHYSFQTIDKKYENKRALRRRLWLAENEKPIVAFIGRLDAQKGLELVRHALFYSLNNRAQFVLLGNSPEHGTNEHFRGIKQHLNENPDCHLEISYNEELAHLIYAGADMIIVPSRYEPCGLAQLIAFRYGTVPVVRSVGGLADTVFDKDYSSRPLHERNGYVFDNADNAGIESALWRAIGCYYHFPDHFRQLMINGMRSDYSWKQPAEHYLKIYDYIRDK
jgi:starch synthase